MFNNPGKKLKILAKILFILFSIIPVLIGVLLIIGCSALESHFGIPVKFSILCGMLVIVISILLAWLSTIILYAFATMTDDLTTIKRLLYRIYKDNPVYKDSIAENSIEPQNELMPQLTSITKADA